LTDRLGLAEERLELGLAEELDERPELAEELDERPELADLGLADRLAKFLTCLIKSAFNPFGVTPAFFNTSFNCATVIFDGRFSLLATLGL
jgi:hypothetical protein